MQWRAPCPIPGQRADNLTRDRLTNSQLCPGRHYIRREICPGGILSGWHMSVFHFASIRVRTAKSTKDRFRVYAFSTSRHPSAAADVTYTPQAVKRATLSRTVTPVFLADSDIFVLVTTGMNSLRFTYSWPRVSAAYYRTMINFGSVR